MSQHKPPCPGPDAHVTHWGTPSCVGHRRPNANKPEVVKGSACTRAPMRGQTTCAMHGAKTPTRIAAGARRTDAAKADALVSRTLAEAYGSNVPDVDPGEAMLQAVSWKYAEVVALRVMVAGLDDADRVWGRTRDKSGGQDFGTTEEAKPHVWWVMLRAAEEQLVKFAAAARAAKCDERRIAMSEQAGLMFATAQRRILARMFDAITAMLTELGVTDAAIQDALARAWADAMGVIVPSELRALSEPTEGEQP